jgi:hypothetical protein
MDIMLLSLIVEALIVLYFYLTQNYKYWQINVEFRGMEHCRDSVTSVTFMKTYFSDFCDKIYKDNKHRSMVGIYDFTSPSLMILEPEMIKTVLQTNFSSFSENTIFTIDFKLDPLT